MPEVETYNSVTETPDTKATLEQLERMYSRYRFALDFCVGKDVLEVACGAGQGLGYISRIAKMVVGGDVDEKILDFARKSYSGNKKIEIQKIDAQDLLFEKESFDVVILYEAIYYLSSPGKFINEALRVLKKQGKLIICTVNKEWPDFNPSPYSYKYFSALELSGMLKDNGFVDVALYGGSRVNAEGLKSKIISFIKRAAVFFNLMPKTMKGKQFFKRMFFGKLYPLPAEIQEGMAAYEEPVHLPLNAQSSIYKIIYAVACKK
ncbi:MAG: class I SAM-dependent methyltransferase [Candidatus Omnitrophica bacterium]|nr:class I SAM-dependent methyltransferase [Actinomycetota bacterium]MBU4252276.1 class I SAM-dependent methyltransferase [Candidatus Omnitrophota bacterium]MBU4468608.1 class I SAM-dependent methyltransferase [Candidatus Omnitrophota bacterium]MCG2708253.1 class I SAM-dependent methyltransferase [Candidatus Omnitrophota bacterium]